MGEHDDVHRAYYFRIDFAASGGWAVHNKKVLDSIREKVYQLHSGMY